MLNVSQGKRQIIQCIELMLEKSPLPISQLLIKREVDRLKIMKMQRSFVEFELPDSLVDIVKGDNMLSQITTFHGKYGKETLIKHKNQDVLENLQIRSEEQIFLTY